MEVKMKLLLHMCCAPCTTYSQRRFREMNFDVAGFFYNPNIHPYREFSRRLETLRDYCRETDIPLTVCADYELEKYLHAAINNLAERCRSCYRMRLDETAREAARTGIPFFSTTLSISPYQDHAILKAEGEAAGAKHGVCFVYEDLRPGYRESINLSRELGLYRQPYCGCIFSEKERFYGKGGGR
jgi:hypothetical protein